MCVYGVCVYSWTRMPFTTGERTHVLHVFAVSPLTTRPQEDVAFTRGGIW